MAQQSDYPKTETQLREIQDALYQHSKEVIQRTSGDYVSRVNHYHSNP